MSQSPFRRVNGKTQREIEASRPTGQTGRLANIPEEKWDAYRDAQVNVQAPRVLMDLPVYQLTHPIVVPGGKNAAGDQQILFHQGMGWRESIAKDLLAAAISARIVQKGVLGALTAIPEDSNEQHTMITSAMKMAHMFVEIAHKMREQDLDDIKMKMANQFDAQYAEDKAKLAEEHVVR